jgi:hypothetical protein
VFTIISAVENANGSREAWTSLCPHYNRQVGTHYAHTECLDVIRIGGMTGKQPEVLVTDTVDGKRVLSRSRSRYFLMLARQRRWGKQYGSRCSSSRRHRASILCPARKQIGQHIVRQRVFGNLRRSTFACLCRISRRASRRETFYLLQGT